MKRIEPVAYFQSPLTSKFGIPRQGGLAASLSGQVVFEPVFRRMEAIRGLEGFSHLWMIWGFSANRHDSVGVTVRPPRLGGNERVGVFASRSPFRPNGLGLTAARIVRIEQHAQLGPVIHVQGADLMHGTPIYDIKPYVSYTDCHPDARCGFVDAVEWNRLQVVIPTHLESFFNADELAELREVLSLDPRPQYHDDPLRVYGMPYAGRDVLFGVNGDILTVQNVKLLKK
jgi:tRNA-Thr(GGU) m(6)t(6)A37 methyltransferase TsaA